MTDLINHVNYTMYLLIYCCLVCVFSLEIVMLPTNKPVKAGCNVHSTYILFTYILYILYAHVRTIKD